MSKTGYRETDTAAEKAPINNYSVRTDYIGKPIAEILMNGFFTVDNKWTVLYWNKAAEKILRVQSSAIVGKNLWEVFADVIPLEFYAVYHKAFEKNIPLHFQEYWGEMGRWFDVITYYCDDILSVSFKSSNRSGNLEQPAPFEQQLQVKTSLYKFITEVTNDCLWEWDLVTKEIFWIDGGHKRMFGYPVENALIPQSFWEGLIHPEDKTRILTEINQLLNAKTTPQWQSEYRCKKADGSYAWVHNRGHIIYEEDIAARMIGATQDISEKIVLQQRLMQAQVDREKEVTISVIAAQERERTAIGKELLDDVSQTLGAAKLYAEMAKDDPINGTARLMEACTYIRKAMDNISRISKALAPPFIHLLGLVKCIKILTEDIDADHQVQFTVTDSGLSLETVDERMLLHIYRIVQQQVINIMQHAAATKANIDITKYDREIVLFISDDGSGHDMTKNKNGVGLMNINSLAGLYKGSVDILSSPGKGYTLQVIFIL